MEVHLTPDQQAFIKQAIASGRLQREEEAIEEAFALWELRERHRVETLAAFDESESDLESGRFAEFSEASLTQLGDDLKRDARIVRAKSSTR